VALSFYGGRMPGAPTRPLVSRLSRW
jgi:hypothetical protein